jgi:hypothetical protein
LDWIECKKHGSGIPAELELPSDFVEKENNNYYLNFELVFVYALECNTKDMPKMLVKKSIAGREYWLSGKEYCKSRSCQ